MNTYTKIAINYFKNLLSVNEQNNGLKYSESMQNPKHIACNETTFFITQIENSIVIIDCDQESFLPYSIDACLDFTSNSVKEAAEKAVDYYCQIRDHYFELINQ